MKYSFHPEAKEGLMDAMAYYDSCSPGLGLDRHAYLQHYS